MTRIARKSDGRRIFTDDFKREQIARVLDGELTLAELSRKLGIARSLLQRWKKRFSAGDDHDAAHSAPVTNRLDLQRYVIELQLLVGKQTVELEMLRAEVEALRKGRRARPGPRR